MEQTTGQIAEATGISRFTLNQIAKRGTVPARKQGRNWLIDTNTPEYQQWLLAHQYQPRVKGGFVPRRKPEAQPER